MAFSSKDVPPNWVEKPDPNDPLRSIWYNTISKVYKTYIEMDNMINLMKKVQATTNPTPQSILGIPPGWAQNILTNSFETYRLEKISITRETAQDYGFPPSECETQQEVNMWVHMMCYRVRNDMAADMIQTALLQTIQTRIARQVKYTQQAASNQPNISSPFWNLYDAMYGKGLNYQTKKAELLLCVEFYTDHTPRLRIYVESLVSLHSRTSKDSDWHLHSLIQSPRPIKLWGKDFIIIQTTRRTSDPISEVKIGCKLSREGNTALGEAPRVQCKDSEIKDVRFLCISDLR